MNNIENEIKILLNLFNSAKYDILISKTKKLIKKIPEYLILYNILGSAYQSIGDLKLAKETFIKGYKMDPNNIAIMNNLANVCKNIGEIENIYTLIVKIKDIKTCRFKIRIPLEERVVISKNITFCQIIYVRKLTS